MAETTTTILLVDDYEQGRKEVSRLIGEDFGYKVLSPGSISEVREAITFEVFDSLLIDIDLNRFDDIGDKIDGKPIEDGIDIADFYQELHRMYPGGLYSSHLGMPGSPYKKKLDQRNFPYISISKPWPPDMVEIKARLQPFLEGADHVNRANPLLLPLTHYEGKHLGDYLRAYKRIYREHKSWLDFKFQSVGDRAWGLICGRGADRRYYGKPLISDADSQFPVVTRNSYPTVEELHQIAAEKEAFPFIIWNTRKPEFLDKQFEAAGRRLENIPDHLRDFFGIAMTPLCVRAYEDGMRERAVAYCTRLTVSAQVEVVRQIYRRLYGTPALEDFAAQCRAANLPHIVELYEARVDGIEQDEEPTAWVELRNLGDYRAVSVEPFDLRLLQRAGVEHEAQRFEYVVYRLPNDDVAMSIEPIEAGARERHDH